MKKNTIIHILLVLLLQLSVTDFFAQSIENQKAIWIVTNFMPNVYWQNEESIEEYKIGVAGLSTGIYNKLVELSKTRTVKGKKFTVIQFNNISNISYTHALFVEQDLNTIIKSIVLRLDKQTLLITDQLKNSDLYMINFLDIVNSQKKYDFIPKNLIKNGFTYNRNLFIHGGKTEDLKNLYKELKSELTKETKKFQKLHRTLTMSSKQYETLKNKNINARLENEKQKAINDKHKREIARRENEIYEQEEQLTKIKENIDYQAGQLALTRQKVSDQYNLMNSYQDQIKKRKEKINTQNLLIERKKKEIKTKDLTLSDQNYWMNIQEIVILVFVILLVTAIIMALIVWRVYSVKRKVNRKLHATNKAINKQKEEISRQHKQTDMLNHELERLSIVASETGNAVTIMDANGNFEWINVGFTKLYGYTLQLLTHEIDENILGVSTYPDIEKVFNKCKETKTTQVYESKNETRSGDYVWVQTSLTPITDQDNNISKFITIETDITNIKEAEQKIRKQHSKVLEQTHELEKSNKELERLSLVASETENAIAIMDAVGDFQWVNEGFSRLYGYSFNQLIMEYSKNIITQDTDSNTLKLIRKSIEEKTAVTFDRLEKHADGHKIWVQTTLSPITNIRNKVSNLISITTDISKLKEAEQSIVQKNEELIEQQIEIGLQKNKIDFQNQNINASITYAKTIQTAILPPEDFLNRLFETFVIYKPLEMVSGDFYWNSILHSPETDSHIAFYAVVDCTGHGVPGAFMSMIGSSLLDEIINEKHIFKPNAVLENMNTEIKSILRQESAMNNDSMDVCLCAIEKQKDNEKVKVVFAGAKRPLYYFSQQSNKLVRVKGTRKTIGGIKSIRNKEQFVNHEIILNKGDVVYLSSDGIIDQISEKFEKFGSKRFTDLIEKIGTKKLDVQKELIEENFATHMGNAAQRDDISFMAVKL